MAGRGHQRHCGSWMGDTADGLRFRGGHLRRGATAGSLCVSGAAHAKSLGRCACNRCSMAGLSRLLLLLLLLLLRRLGIIRLLRDRRQCGH